MLRLFLAMALPPDVRQELATVQHRLARRVSGFRWVKPEQLHLTLLFLGDTPDGPVYVCRYAVPLLGDPAQFPPRGA